MLTTKRRPLGQRAQDIGVWAGILRAITFLAVVTNVSINPSGFLKRVTHAIIWCKKLRYLR